MVLTTLQTTLNTAQNLPANNAVSIKTPQKYFIDYLNQHDLVGNKAHQELVKLENRLLNSPQLSAKELLGLQLRVGAYGIRIELLSKLAESGLSTIRKFEQQN